MPDKKNRTQLLMELVSALPVPAQTYDISSLSNQDKVELVIVDAVKGFTTSGAMADPDAMQPMVETIDRLSMRLLRTLGRGLHVTFFRDCHYPDIPEPPYPPHCCMDTQEWEIDDRLKWLATLEGVSTTIDKDCIDGLVGSLRVGERDRGNYDIPYRSHFLQHMLERKPKAVIVVGDCTDICVSDFVVSLLSARNHGLLTSYDERLQQEQYIEAITSLDICVYEPGCATYDYDPEDTAGMPRHPRRIAHHVGLWTMASRGAKILSEIKC
jgi:nicotinamidase-related amidase